LIYFFPAIPREFAIGATDHEGYAALTLRRIFAQEIAKK
jgi:hypothetical protein